MQYFENRSRVPGIKLKIKMLSGVFDLDDLIALILALLSKRSQKHPKLLPKRETICAKTKLLKQVVFSTIFSNFDNRKPTIFPARIEASGHNERQKAWRRKYHLLASQIFKILSIAGRTLLRKKLQVLFGSDKRKCRKGN